MFSLDHIARSLSFKRNDNFSFYQCKPKFCSMTWFSTGFDLGKELNEIIISFVFFVKIYTHMGSIGLKFEEGCLVVEE